MKKVAIGSIFFLLQTFMIGCGGGSVGVGDATGSGDWSGSGYGDASGNGNWSGIGSDGYGAGSTINSSVSSGSFKDSRNGQSYRTVTIGNQTWMAENLNYQMNESICYDNRQSNCNTYGRLYSWKAAMNACPAGWRLPSLKDYERLLNVVGSADNLRATSWGGRDKYGFSVLPSGVYFSDDKDFHLQGHDVSIWSSTKDDWGLVRVLSIGSEAEGDIESMSPNAWSPVRCIKN